jgi:hypothetical protein
MEQTVGLRISRFLVSGIEFSDRVTTQSVNHWLDVNFRVKEERKKKVSK